MTQKVALKQTINEQVVPKKGIQHIQARTKKEKYRKIQRLLWVLILFILLQIISV